LSAGTVCFDQAGIQTMATYTRDNESDKLYTKDEAGNWVLDADLVKEITETSAVTDAEFDLAAIAEGNYDNVKVIDERFTDVATPVEEAEEEETSDDTPSASSDTNWGYLVTMIASILLVAALIVVFIIKFVFNRKR